MIEKPLPPILSGPQTLSARSPLHVLTLTPFYPQTKMMAPEASSLSRWAHWLKWESGAPYSPFSPCIGE